MKKHWIAILVCFFLLNCAKYNSNMSIVSPKEKYGIVIHGGAGNFKEKSLDKEERKAQEAALDSALIAAYAILDNGGSATDAVETAVMILEDSPHFNAGRGSVYNSNGQVEMDASIMDGKSLKAGGIAGVTLVKNPITLARAVMEKSDYVLLMGDGALEFAKEHQIQTEDESYFQTEKSLKKLNKAKKSKKTSLDHDDKHGTVGAVALDKNGNLAAATSTGGLNNKRYGRIGDSSIAGSGTYADNSSCAISCTGIGEFFILTQAAISVSKNMLLQKNTLEMAMRDVLFDKIEKIGGRGGMIGIDKNGNISAQKTTTGMYRGWMTSSLDKKVLIFDEQ